MWFPYEWFDTAEKLDFPRLPPHEEWFSKLKNEMTLSEEAYRASQRIWQEKGMRTFKDLLRFHNNLDFEPFLEALGSIRDSYTGLGTDIFKDAVPLPGVSMKYLLRRTLNKRDGVVRPRGEGLRNSQRRGCQGSRARCFVENDNAYAQVQRREDVSKSSGLRRQRAVSKHNGGRCAMGANAKERRKVYQSSAERQMVWIRLRGHRGAKRVMDEVRRNAAVVLKQAVPSESIPQHMKDYLANSKRKPDERELVGSLSAQKILLHVPLLKWYLYHSLKITTVHQTIDYVPQKIFTFFVNKVTENRGKGDQNSEQALFAEVFKLLGNSSFGKVIDALERHTIMKYTRSESALRKDLRSVWFQDLEEIGEPIDYHLSSGGSSVSACTISSS